MKIFKQKRPVKTKQEWFFYKDGAPVHAAAGVADWFAAMSIQIKHHPPLLPDLTLPDFFLFLMIK